MEMDREELLAVVKTASIVSLDNHAVQMFNKVWLMKNHVLAFNNTSMVIKLNVDCPELGGVDGKLLSQFLERINLDLVDLEMTDKGQLKVSAASGSAKLAVMEPNDFVRSLTKVPVLKYDGIALELAQLNDDISLDAMLNVTTLKAEQAVDFSSLTILIDAETHKLTLFTSDRGTINRSIVSYADPKEVTKVLIPLDYLRALKRFNDLFDGCDLQADSNLIMVNNDDAVFYTKPAKAENSPDFKIAIGRLFPGGKVDPKLLVLLPDDLPDVVARATLFVKDKKVDKIVLRVVDNQLTVTVNGSTNDFREKISFKHPDVELLVNVQHFNSIMGLCDRIYLSKNGVAAFGPNRFSRFIAGYSAGKS